MAKHCTPWKKAHRASGRMVITRRCGANDATIVSGDGYYTFNVYRNGRWVHRGSSRTQRGAKAAASKRIR